MLPNTSLPGNPVVPSIESCAERRELEAILRFVQAHRFVAFIQGDAVVIDIPYINTTTGAEGIEQFSVRSMAEAREQLGY